MPSTVVTSGAAPPLAAQLMASMVQLKVGTPSTSTVHAPQEESSQPRLDPVSCNSWRRTSSSSSLGSIASSCLRPFTRSSMSSLFMAKAAGRGPFQKTEQTFVKYLVPGYNVSDRLAMPDQAQTLCVTFMIAVETRHRG